MEHVFEIPPKTSKFRSILGRHLVDPGSTRNMTGVITLPEPGSSPWDQHRVDPLGSTLGQIIVLIRYTAKLLSSN